MGRQTARVNEAEFVQLPSSQAFQEPVLQVGKLRPRTGVSPQVSAKMFRMKTIHGGEAAGPQAVSHLCPSGSTSYPHSALPQPSGLRPGGTQMCLLSKGVAACENERAHKRTNEPLAQDWDAMPKARGKGDSPQGSEPGAGWGCAGGDSGWWGPSHCGPLYHASSHASVSLLLQTRRLIFTGQHSCGIRVSTATSNACSLGLSSLLCFVPQDQQPHPGQQPQLQPRKQGHLDLQARHRLQEELSTTALCSSTGPPPCGSPCVLTAHYSCDEVSLSPRKEGVCVCVLPLRFSCGSYVLITWKGRVPTDCRSAEVPCRPTALSLPVHRPHPPISFHVVCNDEA